MATTGTATIESYLPGRMRLRVSKNSTSGAALQALIASLEAIGGGMRVAMNTLTGGMLLEFDPEVVELAEILAVLEAANVVLDVGLHVSQAVLMMIEAASGPRVSKAAHREHEHLRDLDLGLHRITGGAASVRGFLPFLLIAAIVVALRHGWLSPEGLRDLVGRLQG